MDVEYKLLHKTIKNVWWYEKPYLKATVKLNTSQASYSISSPPSYSGQPQQESSDRKWLLNLDEKVRI